MDGNRDQSEAGRLGPPPDHLPPLVLTPEQPPVRPRHHWGRRVALGLIAVLVLISVTLYGLSYGLRGRPIDAPQWITQKVEGRINASMAGAGSVRIGRIVILVDETGIPRIRLRDVRIFDGRMAEVAALNDAGAALSIAALRERKLEPETLRLSGAQVVIRRRADGQFDLSFGGGGKAPSTGSIATALNEIDVGFSRAPLKSVRSLTASDLTITLEDARSRRVWQVTGGRLTLTHDGKRLDLSLSFEVFNGTEELATVQMSFQKDNGSPELNFGARFENAAAADIALQSPALTFLSVLDAPISGALRGRTDASGALAAFTGTLEIGKGALQPTPETRGVVFDAGRAYFTYFPADERLSFSELSVRTEAARIRGVGQAFLREFEDGWPRAFVGQFALADMRAEPGVLLDEAVTIESGAVDLRLRLDPFTVEVGQLVLSDQGDRLLGKGRISATPAGWSASADLSMDRIDARRVLALWPRSTAPKTRDWLVHNVLTGELGDLNAAFRTAPGVAPVVALDWSIRNAAVRYLPSLPLVTGANGYAKIEDNAFTLVVEEGRVNAPLGGNLDVAGSSLVIPDVTLRPARMEVALRTQGSAEASLSLVDLPPFQILKNSALTADVIQGQADVRSRLGFPLIQKLETSDVDFLIDGTIRDVQSDTLTAPRRFSSDELRLTATPQAVEVSGPVRVGRASGEGLWERRIGSDVTSSSVTGSVRLDNAFLDEFGIALPAGSVRGAGTGDFVLTLTADAPPAFTLSSDLAGLALRFDPLGWSKPGDRAGRLTASGELGPRPEVTDLALSASGLEAMGGEVTLADDGTLGVARFEQIRAGDWLDVALQLIGRGEGIAPAVEITGGRMDLRGLPEAETDTSGRDTTIGSKGPLQVRLDRLTVSDSLSLDGFRGSFSYRGGFNGDFTARVNGGAAVTGQVAPSPSGSVVRIQSPEAGAALRDSGVFTTARGGALDLTLTPTGAPRSYNGALRIADTKIVGASPVAELLSALSIVGLLEQLSGPGIRFSDVAAQFHLNPERLTLLKSSAIGPSLGVSLEGVYDISGGQMDMQGVISPVYFLNGLGQLLSRNREGLFGFNFTMRGDASDPTVSVNPLSILTPGVIRDIFRKPRPSAPTE